MVTNGNQGSNIYTMTVDIYTFTLALAKYVGLKSSIINKCSRRQKPGVIISSVKSKLQLPPVELHRGATTTMVCLMYKKQRILHYYYKGQA